MKFSKVFFYLIPIISVQLFLIGCGNEEDITVTAMEEEEPEAPALLSSDIAVLSSESLILWNSAEDLNDKLEDALSYSYDLSLESETEKSLSVNNDSTLATATIVFKEEFQNKYRDTNTSNNVANIDLEKETQQPTAVVLSADGPGDTYELITSILGPDGDPIEVPDCGHSEFGRHIDELFDSELNTNVFRFYLHTEFDNDRCINFDRQRNEIKTYDKSPDNLLGVEGEKVVYKWKFKLPEGFQSSPNFTHIHQLKSVGETVTNIPMYTLTTRKRTPDRLELRHAENNNQVTLKQTDLAPFIGVWLEVTETITYGVSGTYDIEIKRVDDNTVLFEYANDSIQNWQPGASFVRPKWGIYRSLLNAQDLRDESLLYNDFSIQELND